MPSNTQIHLASRPGGEATVENFKVVQAQTPPLVDGQVLVRHHYISLDPYMRGRMNDTRSYTAPQPLGEVMQGASAGEVIESRHADFKVGDKVLGEGGWQEYSVADGNAASGLRKVDDTQVPLSYYLGAVGMPGVTAWYGLTRILKPTPGDTVVVSAATGAVGSAFGALAKARGLRVVGIAGGPEKCRYATEDLGFDVCIDYKAHQDIKSLSHALADAAPNGVQGYFENVGGYVFDSVLSQMKPFGRIALCGLISSYDGAPQPWHTPSLILTQRLLVQGFIVTEHQDDWPQALKDLSELVVQGKLKPRESISEGIDSAPEAFLGLLRGKNFGKQLVKLVD